MAKVTYRGPADSVELDGIVVERDKPVELYGDQLVRLRNSDAHSVVEVHSSAPETPRELARIRAEQDEAREKRIDAADREEIATADFVQKSELATAERARKNAAERDKLRADAVRERDQARNDAALRSTPKREKVSA